jgi:hypothetical protein
MKNALVKMPEYLAWRDMRSRCNNRNHRSYMNYGGRGIEVCSQWQFSFQQFLTDVGFRPGAKYSLDRKDNNGHYEPDNVRWSTLQEQNSNRRNNFVVIYRGEQMPLAVAMRKAGFPGSIQLARYRLRAGCTVEDALETPIRDYIPGTQDDAAAQEL